MILIERGGDLVSVPDGFGLGPAPVMRVMEFEAPWQTKVRERANARRQRVDADVAIAAAVASYRAEAAQPKP